MNNCIYLKNRKGKPFCKHPTISRHIDFKECSNCTHKEYKPKKVYRLKQNKPMKKGQKQAKSQRKDLFMKETCV